MTTDNDTAGSPLSPSTKPTHSDHASLSDRLMALDDQLHQLLESHHFYHTAMIALAQSEDNEPEPWLIGAIYSKDGLYDQGEILLGQLGDIRYLAKASP